MKKIILLISVVAIIAAGWFFYFSGDDKTPIVSIVSAEYRNLSNTLEFSGEVVPKRMYSVMSTVGGQIKNVYVSEGSFVSAGDELILLDATQIDIELEKARLSYDLLSGMQSQTVMAGTGSMESLLAEEKAKIALALSQTTGYDYESFGEAFGVDVNEGASAMASALEDMQMSDVTDMSNIAEGMSIDTSGELALAEMAVKGLENALEQMSIVSEMDGCVILLNINEGEVLVPGLPAMVIADTQSTLIYAYVYEKDVDDLSEGMDVRISSDSGFFIGTLSKIGKAAAGVGDMSVFDTMTKVEITPEGSFSRMPGAVVDLEITVSKKDDVLALPMDCFTDANCVYVVDEEGKVQKRIVSTGFKDAYYAEIISGVSVGDMVVASPKNLLEGQCVKYDRSE